MYRKAAADQRFITLLQLCDTFSKLTQVQGKIIKMGFQNNQFVLTKFISVSSELDSVHYACSFVFSKEPSRPHLYDTFLYNTVIRAYAQTARFKPMAIRYYNEMLVRGIEPTNYTYPFVFKACSGIGELSLSKSAHGSVVKLGFYGDKHVMNAMLHVYCSCEGGITFGEKVFDEMPKADSVPWSTMMGGYRNFGLSNEVIKLFREMQISGVRPDEITMVILFSACADLGSLKLGMWAESYIKKENLKMNSELCNALIDMFSKCGDVDKALILLRKMPETMRTIVSWTSVIFGMSLHGRGNDAISLFKEMKQSGEYPDDVTFMALLSACSHSGLVEEGKQLFMTMVNVYRIEPRIEHYGCMVDLLSRAGLVKEAIEFIDRMPMAPNPVICRTLIAACHEQDELKLSEGMNKHLLKEEAMESSYYVLLSNIYVKMSEWEKKSTIRDVMQKNRARKIPGHTMVD